MAATIQRNCVKCDKIGGTLLCNGCQQIFCFKHVQQHKEEIETQLENLIAEENNFEDSLSKNEDSHELFDQIDQWKKENIEQIKQIVKQAKQDLRQIINHSNEQLMKSCQEIKGNLHLLRQSEDLAENELLKLSNQLKDLKGKFDSYQLVKSSNTMFLRIEKNEPKPKEEPKQISDDKLKTNLNLNHSRTNGSIRISDIDPYGHFIAIEHTGLTNNKQQDMVGWVLKRSIDSYKEMFYRFPNDFSLNPKSSVKILSKQASKTIYAYDIGNCLVADIIQTWGTGINVIVNTLIDAEGNERDVLTQILK